MRTPRSDSVASAVQDVLDVAKGLPDPPAHVPLRKRDLPYWEGIVSHRPRDQWTDTELTTAAQLARIQSDITVWMEQLDREPAVIISGRNETPKPNPLARMIEEGTRRQLALMRMLGLSSPVGREKILRRQQLRKAGVVRATEQAVEAVNRRGTRATASSNPDDLLA